MIDLICSWYISKTKSTTSNGFPNILIIDTHVEFEVVTPIMEISIPRCATKTTIEVVNVDAGNVNGSRKTRG